MTDTLVLSNGLVWNHGVPHYTKASPAKGAMANDPQMKEMA